MLLACGAPTGTDLLGERTWPLAPGEFAEADVSLRAGETVRFELLAGGRLRWNVHHHAGARVVVHQAGEGALGTVSFTAPADGVFSFQCENASETPLAVTLRVRGEGRLVSLVP
jgi:hypothetical protein